MSPSSHGPVTPHAPRWRPSLAHVVLLALALPDLVAAPISPTIHRQTQTYVQIGNLAAHGFSWDAFSLGLDGAKPFRAIFEFPILVVGLPFIWWLRVRGRHTDPAFLQLDRMLFFGGELRRFLSPGFYVKPMFIIGAMVCAGAGLPLAMLGLRRLDPVGWALVAGIPLFFLVIPTAADQTYYSFALAPIFAILIARGWLAVELRFPSRVAQAAP